MGFEDQVIIVSGGSSGIGAQIALDVARKGATVCIFGSNKNKINKFLSNTNHDRIHGYQCDVSNEKEVKSKSQEIIGKFGKIDGLVNSAGINPSRNNIINTSLKDWQETLNVNLTGAFICCKTFIPLMINTKKGSIVNISSIAGISALENRASYMSSKWGLVGLSSSIAIDFSHRNIRINTICPGYVETPLTKDYINNLNPKKRNKLINSHLIGRLGKPVDISKCAIFLLSNDSSWITGAVIPVDGGFTVGQNLK